MELENMFTLNWLAIKKNPDHYKYKLFYVILMVSTKQNHVVGTQTERNLSISLQSMIITKEEQIYYKTARN